MSKKWWSQRGHKWRHNTALTSCLLNKQGYMHACAFTCPRSRAHKRTLARTHAHTHTRMQYLLLFNSKNNSRTRLSVTLYVHCLVLWLFRWDISGNQRVGVRLLRIWSFIGEQTPWIESVKILRVKLKSAKNLFPVVLVYFHIVQDCINKAEQKVMATL